MKGDIIGVGTMIESLMAAGLNYRAARDTVEDLHADHHNLWATLEGNTAQSDVRWFAEQIYEEMGRDQSPPYGRRFDDLPEIERKQWEDLVRACLARLPFLMLRVANRCKAIADATKLIIHEPRGNP